MDVARVRKGQGFGLAVIYEELPQTINELRELAGILAGHDPRSAELLTPVFPGSVPACMGAKHTMFLVTRRVPEGGFGVGGIYGVSNWVRDFLSPAMPDGLGAALSQPALFDTQKEEGGDWYYMVVISPMPEHDPREIFLGEPHDEVAPTLIFA